MRDKLPAFALGVLATLLAMHVVPPLAANTTSLGRRKAVGEKAFILTVNLQFTTHGVANALVREWTRAAEYCLANENFLFAYEMAQSDQDPLRYMVIERYRSKADYLGAHRSSTAFKEFRPKMKELQTRGDVVVSGASYNELGVGFT